MALVPHKITALAESDADGTDGKNIIAGAVVSLFDTTGAAVTLFDDEAGNNGSTAKQTDSSGQVVVWVTPGEYSESVNGSTQRAVTIGGRTITSYANTASLENSRPTQTGQRSENRDRDNAQYVLAPSGYTPLPGDVVAANGRVWSLILGGYIYPEQVGNVTTNTDGVMSDSGVLSANVGIPIFLRGKYTLSSDVDMSGADIFGFESAEVDGHFNNVGVIKGFVYGKSSGSDKGQTLLTTPRTSSLPSASNDNKVLCQFASNPDIWAIFTQNEQKKDRDTIMIMRRGNGGDNSPWEHIRSQQVYQGQAFAYNDLANATLSGAWDNFSASPLQMQYPDNWGASFDGYNFFIVAKNTTEVGAYLELNASTNKDGKVRVTFLMSTIGVSSSKIYIDGVEKADVSTRVSVSGPRYRSIDVDAGTFADTVTVRIEHNGVEGQSMNVLAVNMHRPAETDKRISYDKFAYYYDKNAYYSATIGAGDYAISNSDLGFFGSYHGAETAIIDPEWRIDGVKIPIDDFVAEKPYVGLTIDLFEKTDLAGIAETQMMQRWESNSTHSFSMSIQGKNGVPFKVNRGYFGMSGTFEKFQRTFLPRYEEGVVGTENDDVIFGMNQLVAQENEDTGQVVYTYCNMPDGNPSSKGMFIKTLDETGFTYQKVYYGWFYDAESFVDNLSFNLIKMFR